MTPKKHIENLVRRLRKGIPRAEVAVDTPSRASGNWFVDVRAGKQAFAVEFRPTLGFGLSSTPSDGLGAGPDEFIERKRPWSSASERCFDPRRGQRPNGCGCFRSFGKSVTISFATSGRSAESCTSSQSSRTSRSRSESLSQGRPWVVSAPALTIAVNRQ
jgi:hypothetical protein